MKGAPAKPSSAVSRGNSARVRRIASIDWRSFRAGAPGELAEVGGIGQRFELGTFAFLEPDLLAERIGHHEDVGEDDGGIEPEPPHRLQRDLDRLVRRVAEFEERARRRPDGAILRQVAPGLAHQPDRRRRKARSGQTSPGISRCSLLIPHASSSLFIIGSRSSRGCGENRPGAHGDAPYWSGGPGGCGSANADFDGLHCRIPDLQGHSSQPVRKGWEMDGPGGSGT